MIKNKSTVKQTIISLILFSGLGLFSYFLLINSDQFPKDDNYKLTSFLAYVFAIITFNILGFTIIKLSRWIDNIPFAYSVRRIVIYIFAALILLFINYGILVIAKTLINVQNPFIFQNGGHRILIAVWLIELVVISLLLANRSAMKLIEYQKEASRLQQENDNSKLMALQNQLNPHFLFNSLNTLVSEIEYNPKKAIRFTHELSDVYRYVLQSHQKKLVLLQDEIAFLESYIYLHRVRLGNCIVLENNLPTDLEDIKIAPLSLQLLSENALKHNIVNDDSPMTITLSFNEKHDFLIVSNVLNKKLTNSESGIGLKNLSTRYRLLSNKDIEVINDINNGLFTVKIPLIYE